MKLAIVILNWNGKALLKRFLPSVVNYSEEANIYVIDNNSSDESIDYIQSNFPSVKLIRHDKNYGFSEGYNLGLKDVEEDLLCLLNNDVEVTPNWLSQIIKCFNETDASIGQPMMLQANQKNYFDYAGAAGGFIDSFGYPYCQGRIFDYIEKNEDQYNSQKTIFWASGACFFVRKSTWIELGGFDSSFFMHQEEIDFCWRAFNSNKKVVLIPESKVFHLGAASLKLSPRKTFFNHRNSLFMLYKNLPSNRLWFILFVRMVLDGIASIKYLLSGSFMSFLMILKAHLNFYSALARLHKSRNGSKNKLDYARHTSIVWSHFILRKNKFQDLL